MTKHEWADIVPDFDVLQWKQETQTEIYQEIKDMTPAERIAYFRKGSDAFREEQSCRSAERGNRISAKELI